MPGRRLYQGLILAIAVALAAPASGDPLIDRLATTDRAELVEAVAAVEGAPAETPDLADALFTAARACEDTLADPARALALYERILRDHPDAGVSIAARRRADSLRGRVGTGNVFAGEAAAFARLVAEAEQLAAADVVIRAQALLAPDWSGAPEVGLWLAEWQRRHGELTAAQATYASVTARWPGTAAAVVALRGGAGTAIELDDWDLAEQLAGRLPAVDPADRILRDDLLAAAAAGRQRGRLLLLSWIVVALVFLGLAASLLDAARRGGWRRPVLRPPIEVVFMTPVALVLGGVALTTHQLIAPAVIILSIGGLALAYLSGITLDTLRLRDRSTTRRSLLHVFACVLAIAALLYIVLVRDDLLAMVIETVRFGPE